MSKTEQTDPQIYGARRNARPNPEPSITLVSAVIAALAADDELISRLQQVLLNFDVPAGVSRIGGNAKGADAVPAAIPAAAYDRFMRLPEVLHVTGLGRSTLYEKIGKGRFPKQVALGENIVAWYESEILSWLAKPT